MSSPGDGVPAGAPVSRDGVPHSAGPAAGKRMSGSFDIQELLRPEAYGHPVTGLVLLQTHVSWVVLTGPYAYKIKKPVHFDFLDASTLERRAALCAEELRLNRRFAPAIYQEVVPVVREADGVRVGGSGPPVEFALRMCQFEPDLGLREMLDRNAVTGGDMQQIGRMLAELHRAAPVAAPTSRFGRHVEVRGRILRNIRQLRCDAEESLRPHLDRIAGLATRTLELHAPQIEARRLAGHVRECHGDLHAGNVVQWQGQWMAFDCLEFDPALRWIDTISDTAFLFMDVLAGGRADLACEFLSTYVEESGDHAGLPLLPLHVADRALIRARVELLGAVSRGPAGRAAAVSSAAGRVYLASQWLQQPTGVLILMHGLAASGKSWLAAQLVCTAGALRIRSDVERKRLSGRLRLPNRPTGIDVDDYSPQHTQRTYTHLLHAAEAALQGGCNVIVDAGFLHAWQRDRFRAMASQAGARLLVVSCQAPPTVLRERLRLRASEGLDPSEATTEVLDHQLRTQEPLSADEQRTTILVDTADPLACARAVAAVGLLSGRRPVRAANPQDRLAPPWS